MRLILNAGGIGGRVLSGDQVVYFQKAASSGSPLASLAGPTLVAYLTESVYSNLEVT